MAYRGSQARGQIGASAKAYATATARPDPSRICDQHCKFQQSDPELTEQGQDQIRILMETLSGS